MYLPVQRENGAVVRSCLSRSLFSVSWDQNFLEDDFVCSHGRAPPQQQTPSSKSFHQTGEAESSRLDDVTHLYRQEGTKIRTMLREATRAKRHVREFAVFRSPASRRRPQSRGVSIANHRGRPYGPTLYIYLPFIDALILTRRS